MAFVVSCLAEGLWLVDGDRIDRLDAVPSAGLARGPHGAVRAVHEPAETATSGLLLRADGRSFRAPGLQDVHELAWEDDLLACVSTLANSVLWVDRAGRVEHRWRAPGEGDCWHLSGITPSSGGALVTAFGRFRSHRRWAEAHRDRAGLVVEVPSGRVVARGFSSPHSPRLVDGRLALCDSGRGEVVVGSRRVELGGWTRGLAVTKSELVVGVSASRGTVGQAHLAVLTRGELRLVRRVRLPVREVFDVLELPAAEARKLARPGPAPRPTAPFRPRDLRARVEASKTLQLRPGALATIVCTVTNLGSGTLASAPPHPISLVSSWRGAGRALWSPMPRALGPGERSAASVRLLAPSRRGRYDLELRLVQEGVAWLEGEARAEVEVS